MGSHSFESKALFKLRLFQSELREIIFQIIHQLADAFPGFIIYHKNALTAHVLHPLSDHGDIGMGGIHLGNDPNQRAEEKIPAAITEQIKVARWPPVQWQSHPPQRETGKSYAEMLGLCIFSR